MYIDDDLNSPNFMIVLQINKIQNQNGGLHKMFTYQGVLLHRHAQWCNNFNVFDYFVSVHWHDPWMSLWTIFIPSVAYWWPLLSS